MVGTWASITHNDLVPCGTKLVVMSWDVVRSLCLVKYGELPTSYLRVTYELLRVATIFKATSRELHPHLASLLRHSYIPTSIHEFPPNREVLGLIPTDAL